MLIHKAIPSGFDDGLWLVVYTIPGTTALSAIGEGYSERAARTEAHRLNVAAEARNAQELAVANADPAERHLAPGMYEDKE